MLKLGHEVYQEYQRQLWDPDYLSKNTTEEYHFHTYGSLGVLFLDQRGNKITVEGKQQIDNPMISAAQWKWIEDSFNTTDLACMVVCSEIPFVENSPEEAKKLVSKFEFLKDHWSYNKVKTPIYLKLSLQDDLVRFLEICFNWMSKFPEKKRQVVLATGDIHVGVETMIRDRKTGLEIKQLVASPITNHVCEFFPKVCI
jgi:hypothetical protein